MPRVIIIQFTIKCKAHGDAHAQQIRAEFESWDEFEHFRKEADSEGFIVENFRALSNTELATAIRVVHVVVASADEMFGKHAYRADTFSVMGEAPDKKHLN